LSTNSFEDIQLLERLPRYPTAADKFRLDSPAAARFRQIVSQWIAADLPASRTNDVSRLLAPRNSLGAFHELLLRQVLRNTVGEPTREPTALPVGRGRPDFSLLVGRSKRLVVLESTTIEEPVDQATARRRAIMVQLDRISGPWHLIPHWSWCVGLDGIRPSVIERAVREALGQLPPNGKHEIERRFGTAIFKAAAIRASKHRMSVIAADFSGGLRYSVGDAAIRQDIKKKTAKYRGLKLARIPFILAIGSDSPLIDWESVFDAMYGNEQIAITLRGQDVVAIDQAGLDYSGHVTPKADRVATDTTLSAVWSVRWQMRDGELYAEVVHLPNPWAANPIRMAVRDISHVIWRRGARGQIEIRKPQALRQVKVS
jgi:hypothetical protein